VANLKPMAHEEKKWDFWIDRGGTFTDVIGRSPDGVTNAYKLLSENPLHYPDAVIEGIRCVLELDPSERIPLEQIASVKMGTTVATNALLERRGEPTLLVITKGLGDLLQIGYQTRPDLFAKDIRLPEMLYSSVLEVDERVSANGDVLQPLNQPEIETSLRASYDRGINAVAIVLLHGYLYVAHEKQIEQIARQIGFEQVSVSHQVNPLTKMVPRGDTTVVDAYLSPVLRRYISQVENQLKDSENSPALMFMQSNGGLTQADQFKGKDALLSGPAGGVVGMVETAQLEGFDHLIGFDMGGTSTDVSHFAGELERSNETEVAGVRVRAPMMDINTVAAGGGSIVFFDGTRQRVGPASAGAQPGPTCYGNNGPLTITDCNVILGKLRPEYFPKVFGPNGNAPLDIDGTINKFELLKQEISKATGKKQTVGAIAEGFIEIAVENMANAIKKISVERGHDVSTYTLCCFGGAGGQHACLIADKLGIQTVFLHRYGGVLSALGMGLADVRDVREKSVELPLSQKLISDLQGTWLDLETKGQKTLANQGIEIPNIATVRRLAIRYAGSDTAIHVAFGKKAEIVESFERLHRARFGFISPEKELIVESIQNEASSEKKSNLNMSDTIQRTNEATINHPMTIGGEVEEAPFLFRSAMASGTRTSGPAVIIEKNATTVVEPGWQAELSDTGSLILHRIKKQTANIDLAIDVDPIQLEIFNNLFMNIAEQMGVVLENTSVSVNIKERLDFSCAIFDADGELIANAPHLPIHLGSMSEAIKTVIANNPNMVDGDGFVLNAPYNGGTHLPDITVVKPIFDKHSNEKLFYVAARGHHADIGGVVPGSAPADSTTINEEGIVIDNFKLIEKDRFLENEIRALLGDGPWPARNIDYNIADLKAQVAACERGASELQRIISYYGLEVVHAYMEHVKNNAEESVRRVIAKLVDSSFTCEMDDGNRIVVSISVDPIERSAKIDFTGTSAQHAGNMNAPQAVCRSAVLYAFRLMVDDSIPLNAGCLKPLEIVIPDPSLISPHFPAAVIAGNVETSQLIVDTLLGAMGVMAGSQGTMNNFIWGNDDHQYYETICGGAGATANQAGASAVHTHMTNTRLTDPEIMEIRHPVRLEHFRIRRNSGGDGKNPGGDGVSRRVKFLEPMTVNILSSRRKIAPYGAAGGEPGQTGTNILIPFEEEQLLLGGFARFEVQAGDSVQIDTPGGGGHGLKAIGNKN
jgi:5-oxoprolinase (ATP-hydrolysing)